ncbi:MAG TPA: 1-acyl-sn-glycerol-3-phosphate acyltransferase [Lentisphaeria bacterium]|nr:MAG: hypothetical protein A2X47_01785 [Lentisphaerae bacterium GWF2_38_69]HBM15663.1 1-acyl-sn-glycerol-3-phosphate acyltransferase [Lentisphaeria bacterium]
MKLDQLYSLDSYDTPSSAKFMLGYILFFKTRLFFFYRVLKLIMMFSKAIRKGKFSNQTWCDASFYIFKTIEGCEGKVHIKGLNNILLVDGPAVFIGNHMSSLETFVLPGLICPKKPATFVVKASLMSMPRFGEIMKASKAIAVGRKSPIDDFKAVMKEGKELLSSGTSIIIFPQSTRGVEFIPEQFNSIGVKLAKNAGVPIIPVALKTDFWGNGKWIKDFGPIHKEKHIYFEFGTPIIPDSNGKLAHQKIISFVQEKLKVWSTC